MNTRAEHSGNTRTERSGFAMITVVFVLVALFVLCAPFLFTARNASETGVHMAEQAQLRLAQDAAGRHGRLVLGASHPAVDTTLDWDSLDELTVDTRFDPGFLDAHDPNGVMWDLDVTDEAGRIDLNSAGPHVIANVLGLSTLLTDVVEPADVTLSVSSTAGFGPEGYLWIDGEIVYYGAIEGSKFVQCTRGLGATYDEEGEPQPGALPPAGHALGTPVLDQRVFALPLWRIAADDGVERHLDAPEQLLDAEAYLLAGAAEDAAHFTPEEIESLFEVGSVHAGVTGGRAWQHSARLATPVIGGETQRISVSEPRWFAVGATIRVRDEDSTELAMVIAIDDQGFVLDHPLQQDHFAFDAEVSVLAKRPVNLNTASPAVLRALFQNLQLRTRNARVLPSQANQLASHVIAMRPFEGFQDFLERLVLPAAGLAPVPAGEEELEPFLAGPDALALYANGLNANDVMLEFATMPYSFVSREVYDMELRAAVNAQSGVQRSLGVRERVELVAPQRELFYVWTRQADFDEALRLDCEAPWWMTGPEATSRFDETTVPPSRLTPHFGTVEGSSMVAMIFDPAASLEASGTTIERVFASREEDAYCQLWPSRHHEDTEVAEGRVLHFDHETRDPEGRYLPDETIALAPDDPMVSWNDAGDPLLKSLSYEAWIRPRTLDGGMILDVGGVDTEVDRLSLLIEEGDLVLRVLDGFGDHRGTVESEVAELRFSVAPGTYPGLPVDIWSHVAIDVRGNRPTQMMMLVNGLAHGVRSPGLTRLSAGVGQSSEVLPVESTDGFPARGVARVGNELVEYLLDGGNALRCVHQVAGPDAGFGGRLARVRFDDEGLPFGLAETEVSHPAGTSVELYGYSLPLISNLPSGGSRLPDALGLWRVARVIGVEGEGIPVGGDAIIEGFAFVGNGIEGTVRRPAPFELVLADADAPFSGATEFMEAFQPGGGYAALVSDRHIITGTDGRSSFGVPVGGLEVIRYSGWSGTSLQVVERANVVNPKLQAWRNLSAADLEDLDFAGTEGRAFVFTIDPGVYDDQGPLVGQMAEQCYVFPISLTAGGSGVFSGFLDPIAQGGTHGEHAQITHVSDAELTEWVRYDEILESQLLRSRPGALSDARWAIVALDDSRMDPPPDDDGGGGGGGGTNPPAEPPPPPPEPPAQGGVQWSPIVGTIEDADYPLTRSVRESLRFRGVMGTYTHAHPVDTPLLPVFRVEDAAAVQVAADGTMVILPPEYAIAKGLPGRGDSVFVSGPEIDHVGWPLTVHRAYRPWSSVQVSHWRQEGTTQEALPGQGTTEALDLEGALLLDTHVALQEPCPEPISGTIVTTGTVLTSDSRLVSRLCKFPSGERPRAVGGVGVGTSFGAAATAQVPSMVIDEVLFGDPTYATGLAGALPANSTQGAMLGVVTSMGADELELFVWPNNVETAVGFHTTDVLSLAGIPDAALLRVGDEIIACSGRDPASGRVDIAVGGRGLLGTTAQPHQRGEPVVFLEQFAVGILAAPVGAGEGILPLADASDFPRQGTVLIGSEIAHYTHQIGGALAMPRGSAEPGRMDGEGPGLFRGRFGTGGQPHQAGEAVILFPFRYWDRWAPLADAPELAYFGMQMHQPRAWWRDYFWEWEPSLAGGSRMGVLARSDRTVPWDSDPDDVEGLWLHWDGDIDGAELPLGVQSDQLEWRVFVEFEPGAFDITTGLAHGWKSSPQLRRMGVDYLAPNQVLRSVDR